MGIFFSQPHRVHKARSRVRATPRRLEALHTQMSNVVSASLLGGFEKLQDKVSPQKLMDAFKKGDYKPLIAKLPTDREAITDAFLQTVKDIESTIDRSAAETVKDLGAAGKRLEYNADNPRTEKFVSNFTGELAQRLSDDMQENLKSAVRDNLINGTPLEETAQQIRQSIGLNARQAVALQNFKGDKDAKADYAERLLDERSMLLARTEVSFAQNEARLQVWDEAQDQGLIGQNATKIWMVDGAPCDLCEPMDGQEVSLDEPFVTEDGEELWSPPYHPRCLCQVILGATT